MAFRNVVFDVHYDWSMESVCQSGASQRRSLHLQAVAELFSHLWNAAARGTDATGTQPYAGNLAKLLRIQI
jgi:hypothetical protein